MLRRFLLVTAGLIAPAACQTLLDPAQLKRPVKTGTVLPSTCTVGDLFFNTAAPAGANLFGCAATNTWTVEGGFPSQNCWYNSTAQVLECQDSQGNIFAPVKTAPSATPNQWVDYIASTGVAHTSQPTAAQVANAVDQTTNYSNPAWISSLAWGKLTGIPLTFNAGLLQGRTVSGTAPTDLQYLGWNNTTGQWEPKTPAAAGVSTAFGRSGAVSAQMGDYSFTQIAGALSAGQLPAAAMRVDQSNTISGGTQDFSQAAHTLPMKSGPLASKPATCSAGESYFATDAQAGSNYYGCTAAGVWVAEGGAAYTVAADGVPVGSGATLNFVTGQGFTNTIVNTGGQINVQSSLDTAVVQTLANAQSGVVQYCASAGGSESNYQCSLNPSLNAYSTGMILNWTPDVNGAGGVTTLTVDHLGAVPVTLADGVSRPGSTDIVAGRLYGLWYDGTSFRVTTSGGSNSSGLAQVATSGSYNDLVNKPLIPTIASTTSLLKGSGTGNAVAATAGVDYAPASHGLLSATHNDTNATGPVTGGLIYANAAAVWDQLPGNTSTTRKFLGQTGTGTASSAPGWVQPTALDITGLAASATIDTTNAGNISSGTLPYGRLPLPTATTPGGVHSMDCTAFGGSYFIQKIGTDGSESCAQADGGTGGTPGGTSGQIQYNSNGAFGGFTLGGDIGVNLSSGISTVKQIHETVTAVNASGSPYTVAASDSYIACNGSSGGVIINLPAATGSGREITAKKIDATINGCTLARAGSDTIDGSTSAVAAAPNTVVKLIDRAPGTWDRLHISQLAGDVTGPSTANTVSGINGASIPASAPLLQTNSSGQIVAAPSTACIPDVSGTTICLIEDWLSGNTMVGTGYMSSQLNWYTNGSGISSPGMASGTWPHIGVYRLATTGSASTNYVALSLSNGSATDPMDTISAMSSQTWELDWIFKFIQTTTMTAYLGLMNNNSGCCLAYAVGLKYDTTASDTTFMFAADGQFVSSGVAVDTNWHHLKIVPVSSGKIGFSLDGGTQKTACASGGGCDITVTLDNSRHIQPGAYLANTTTTALEMDLDYMGFKATVVR
jgi:hypothetical protein